MLRLIENSPHREYKHKPFNPVPIYLCWLNKRRTDKIVRVLRVFSDRNVTDTMYNVMSRRWKRMEIVNGG